MDCCLNCKYARRACNEDYVGCAFWYYQTEREIEPKSLGDIMEELHIAQISTGGVYLGRYPEQVEPPDVIASASVITNHVICFKKTFVCNHHRRRDE